ncbi:MAG TPA: DUF4097 family beta strand repeat-containing protein [Sporosarcina sp.]|nr:DUF4097 family beta strand repeat-containing protein [Sporosarcina sp.]
MQNERKRILTMLENGTITTEEALTLLEKLGESKRETSQTSNTSESNTGTTDQGGTQDTTSNQRQESKGFGKQSSMDEFLQDLQRDFSQVGDRFMQFMQTAVEKVKTFDFDSPLGTSVSFHEESTKDATGVTEVVVDIDNGKLNIIPTEAEEVRAAFSVRAFRADSEEAARKEFADKVLFVNDGNKLRIVSHLKMVQVNVDLYIPNREYEKLSVRLLNGAFKTREMNVRDIQVKTANGKVDVADTTFKTADIETVNGAIQLNGLEGETLEAETLNGRVYIDGKLKDVEAQSLNGHVVVTTTDVDARKVEAKTVTGAVELYVPKEVPLSGEISTNMGRLDLQLTDVERTSEQEQIFQRTLRFKKDVEGGQTPLHIFGEARTGSVLVCYTAE